MYWKKQKLKINKTKKENKKRKQIIISNSISFNVFLLLNDKFVFSMF